MYQPSQNFITELNKTSRLFRARITCGADAIAEEIKKMIFTLGSCGADTFTIGSVFSSYVDITLSSAEFSLAGKEMLIELGLLLPDETVEYIPMGYFTASPANISKSRDQITLKAMDRISSKCGGLYVPSITFPATIQAVMNDVSTQAGITIKTSLPTTGIIQKEMKNLTCRDALGFLAGLLGGFCFADREGNICIAPYPSTSSNEIENNRFWTIEMGEEYPVDSLKVIVSEGGEDADGNEVPEVSYSAGSGNGIVVSNQYMTESLFNSMKSRVLNYSFYSGTVKMLGDPLLEPTDAIMAVDYAGNKYLLPCMSVIHEYDGGLATTIATPSQASSDDDVRGPFTQQLEQLAADMVLAKEVIAKKITADEADLKFATIEKANIIEAEIEKVSGEFADYKVIVTEDLTAANAEIDTIKGNLADYKTVVADNLTAVNAEITTVKGDLADYKTVVAGDIDALSGRIDHITGELSDYKTVVSNELITAKGWMAEGSIGNAQISSVDAAKIKSGILDTALVTVKGTNGNLQIIDNTISISDSNRVRVQVGKDGSGDYTLAVWDAAGNLIWDALGATENTIQRPIIRDEVVADDACIKGTKLDIESVVTAVNGATTKITGTAVKVGDKTLEVALSEQETTITEQGQQISDHEARITENEESIKLKVSSQDFETYKSTVGGEITTVKSRLSTAETSITAMEGQIALKVEQTDIDTAINAVEIGGRNLIVNNNTVNGWVNHNGSVISYYAYKATDYIPVAPGDTITFQLWTPSSVQSWIDDTYFDSDKNYVTGYNGKYITSNHIIKTYTVPEGAAYVRMSYSWATGYKVKLEKGNKPTDWTPAPEDTEESITTISNKQAEIITNIDSITTRVSSVESSQETQAGEVASMESRLSVAEQKVTKDGIISTVGSYYTTSGDVDEKVSEAKEGLVDKANIVSCINQTAEAIKIQASKIALEGLVTANENFKILTDGSIETIAGIIGGWRISNNQIFGKLKEESGTLQDSVYALIYDSSGNQTETDSGEGKNVKPNYKRYWYTRFANNEIIIKIREKFYYYEASGDNHYAYINTSNRNIYINEKIRIINQTVLSSESDIGKLTKSEITSWPAKPTDDSTITGNVKMTEINGEEINVYDCHVTNDEFDQLNDGYTEIGTDGVRTSGTIRCNDILGPDGHHPYMAEHVASFWGNPAMKCSTSSGTYWTLSAFTSVSWGYLDWLVEKNSNDVITIKRTGVYVFSVRFGINSITGGKRVEIVPFINGKRVAAKATSHNTTGDYTIMKLIEYTLRLSIGDTVCFKIAPVDSYAVQVNIADCLIECIDYQN